MRTLTEERTHQSERAPRSDTRSWLQDEVTGRWAFSLLAAWYALFLLAQYLQPEAHDVSAVLEWIGIAFSVAFTAALLVAGIGLAMRRRWGLVASIAAAGLLVADSIACPMTGHHHFGAWVVIQAVGSVALAGASIRALRRT
jgi:hypothetical protein